MTFTDSAAQALQDKMANPGVLRLVYDTEGCGCAVNGVPQLWILEERAPLPNEIRIDGSYPVLLDRSHEIFFEDELILDFQPVERTYRLKSANQIYQGSLNIIDRRL